MLVEIKGALPCAPTHTCATNTRYGRTAVRPCVHHHGRRQLGEFCPTLERKFAPEPASSEDWHRPVPEGMAVAHMFYKEETGVVNNPWTVHDYNRWLYMTTGTFFQEACRQGR